MFTAPAGMLKRKGAQIPDVPFERWILQSPSTVPSARCAADMAFYPGLGVVMVGGTTNPIAGASVHDPYNVGQTSGAGTWVWTGTDWYKLAVATDARGSYAGGMVYDSVQNKLIKFSSYDAGALAAWSEFNGTNWTNFTGGPMGFQVWCRIAYDKVRQRTVLPSAWTGAASDNWEYNSVTQLWTNNPVAGRTGSYGYGMCFDEYAGKTFSALGNSYRAQYYDGATWSSAGWPGSNPGLDSTTYNEAVWHPVRQTVIIKTHNETWEWNPATSTLSQMSLSNQGPSFNAGAGYIAMAFDYTNGVMVMFGGQAGGMINQTWVSGPL